MDRFDPALHYGPNDAGVSAISIVLVLVGLIVGTWLVGVIYDQISNLITKRREK
tara:strand:+ start:10542 stop:10703 length:162 start_codon:yes stop_codon:yes gene_type:complete